MVDDSLMDEMRSAVIALRSRVGVMSF
jgi:hypothetical protein